MSLTMTLTETIDRFPPCLCRIVARDPNHRGRRLSLHELSKASGLSYGAIARLSRKKSWGNVPPMMIDRFADACGVDLLHPKRKMQYLKRALKSPNGYKSLASKKGHHSPRVIIEMLKGLLQ